MCDYCERGRRIETEIDGEGHMLVYDADPEYHVDGWTLDVYDSEGEWAQSFKVPCCPMCGKEVGA